MKGKSSQKPQTQHKQKKTQSNIWHPTPNTPANNNLEQRTQETPNSNITQPQRANKDCGRVKGKGYQVTPVTLMNR